MQSNSSTKLYAVLAVLVVLVLGYYLFFREAPSQDVGTIEALPGGFTTSGPDGFPSALSGSQTGATGDVGQEIISLLAQINSLTIDPAIFDTPSYRSLVDYTIEIPAQRIGRPNPFEPLPKSLTVGKATTTPKMSQLSPVTKPKPPAAGR